MAQPLQSPIHHALSIDIFVPPHVSTPLVIPNNDGLQSTILTQSLRFIQAWLIATFPPPPKANVSHHL